MDSIVLDNVRKRFGPVCAVDGLSMCVPSGCIYGFLGPNGAGKTTTLRMMMNILRPDSGSLAIFGQPPAAVRDRMGYMPEEKGLYRKMTVAGSLTFFGALKGLGGHQLADRASQWLDRVELSGWANRRVEDLSRGMHQKLQFAITCIHDPDLLILDEPFSGLDPVNLDLLKGIVLAMQQQGKTVIFSTHAMHEAEELCNYIVLINKGRPVLMGTLEQIRSQWPMRSVLVELEGDDGFVAGLPMVAAITAQGRRKRVELADGADPQELLAALTGRARVRAFEVMAPSLHEIFVKVVGGEHA